MQFMVDQPSCQFGSWPLMVRFSACYPHPSKTVKINEFAPFILIYKPEHQFTSTVFVSEMCDGNLSFQLSFVHFLFPVDVEEEPAD